MTTPSVGRGWGAHAVRLLCLSLTIASVALAEEIGHVASLEGTAERQRAGVWAGLAAGEALELHDHVRTGAASKAKLLLRDDSVLTLA